MAHLLEFTWNMAVATGDALDEANNISITSVSIVTYFHCISEYFILQFLLNVDSPNAFVHAILDLNDSNIPPAFKMCARHHILRNTTVMSHQHE